MRKYQAHNENGFTMIEIIVSLVLIGIMAALAGMFLVSITSSYVFSRENNATSLNAQITMAKIVKEIGSLRIETDTITTATATEIDYTYTDPVTAKSASHKITLSGTQIQFDGITLVDNVSTFTLSYFDAAGAVTATKANIRRVDITLSLQGAEGIIVGGSHAKIISSFTDSAKIQESYY